MPGRAWDDRDVELLQFHWGSMPLGSLAHLLNRTPRAVQAKAANLNLGSPRRGRMSLLEAERRSGYDRGTLMIAAKRLGIGLRRGPPGLKLVGKRARPHNRHFAIDEETLEALIEEIQRRIPEGGHLQTSVAREWGGVFRDKSPKPEACLACSRTSPEVPHYCAGYCRRCYERRYQAAKRSARVGSGAGDRSTPGDSS